MNDVKTTPRAIKLTPEAIPTITGGGNGVNFDLPPDPNHLLDAVTMPGGFEYYFVTECPGYVGLGQHGTLDYQRTISWALVPDFMFERNFKFATKPSRTRLISIVEKG